MPNPTQLDHLEELLAKATSRPWQDADGTTTGRVVLAPEQPKVRRNVAACGGQNREANATLIVEAINALPSLIADNRAKEERIRALSGEILAAQEALDLRDTMAARVILSRAARRALAKETDKEEKR